MGIFWTQMIPVHQLSPEEIETGQSVHSKFSIITLFHLRAKTKKLKRHILSYSKSLQRRISRCRARWKNRGQILVPERLRGQRETEGSSEIILISGR